MMIHTSCLTCTCHSISRAYYLLYNEESCPVVCFLPCKNTKSCRIMQKWKFWVANRSRMEERSCIKGKKGKQNLQLYDYSCNFATRMFNDNTE